VLAASRRATKSMLCLARTSIGACEMSANITWALVIVGFIYSMYLAGRIAERRGRRFIIWAWIAAFIGPLALPLVFLFPNLHGKNGDHA
jgi:MFS family permease